MRTSRLPIVLTTAFVLGLTACGDDGPGVPAADAMLPPVAVNAVAGGDGAATSADRLSAEALPSGDMSILPWFGGFTYEVGPGLPELPTDAVAYRFPLGADVDADTVARLATALGVTGAPERGNAADGVLWRVGPDDGTEPSLVVLSDPMVSWYYSAAWESAGSGVDGVVIEPGDVASEDLDRDALVDGDQSDGDENVDVPERLPEAAPPAGVPDETEARRRAEEYVTAVLGDTTGFTFEVWADEWYASVNAWQDLGPVRSPVSWGFGFGGEGRLEWAGGALASPEALGPYPLVDLDTAVARLTEQGSAWGWDVLAARTEPALVDPAVGDGAGGDSAAPDVDPDTTVSDEAPVSDETPPVEPDVMPVPEPMPPVDAPEPEVAVLVDVRADLWWAWESDGTVWLLPAYAFTDTEGRIHVIPAVTEEYLIVTDPSPLPEPEPMPVEPPISEPEQPRPTDPEQQPVEPRDGDAVDPATELPIDPDTLVGLGVTEAEDLASRAGVRVRVIRLDGEDLAATMDLDPMRVNVEVTDDVIVAIVSVG